MCIRDRQSEQQTSSVSAKEVVEKLNEKEYVRAAAEIDDTMASEIYHLNLDDVEDYGILETQISPGPGLSLIHIYCEDLMIIDVRRYSEFKESKIPNAINIPVEDVYKRQLQKHNNKCESQFQFTISL